MPVAGGLRTPAFSMERKNKQRDQNITKSVLLGYTLAELARTFGLSVERTRQIVYTEVKRVLFPGFTRYPCQRRREIVRYLTLNIMRENSIYIISRMR